MPGGGLSVTVVLEESVTELRDSFMVGWKAGQEPWCALGRIDLRRTLLRRIGFYFLCNSRYLTSVTLPPSLTKVGHVFLGRCHRLQCVDLRHTALHTIGGYFAAECSRLTSVVLPDTIIKIGKWGFLDGCGRVEVTSGSTAVRVAAAKHNANVDNG